MKIKDIRLFRQWLKRNARMLDREEDFVGYSNPYGADSDSPDEKRGMFNVFHSSAPVIENRIATVLDMAQDSQAIYEFVQNAVDCNSTTFYMFYDSNHFVVINNGDVFNQRGIKSILNFAQTTKAGGDEGENIGKFGIGFKLIHRMVGEGNSIRELLRDYTGPVLFSWNERQQLEELLKSKKASELKPVFNGNWDDNKTPWLFKILLTCVPILPFPLDDNLRDVHYKHRNRENNSLFSGAEYQGFVQFMRKVWKKHAEKFQNVDLNQGTMFYLRLGKDKKQKLDEDFNFFKRGIQYALHFVGLLMGKKGLNTIFMNNHAPIVKEKIDLVIEDAFVIKKGSETFAQIRETLRTHDRANDIKIMFGYMSYDPKQKNYGNLRSTPNFFKFFPMGKEVNGLNFVVHCNVFEIEASRREFVPQHPVNKFVMEYLAKQLIGRLKTYKQAQDPRFLDIYAAILSSNNPKDQNPYAGWIRDCLYTPLLNYLKTCVPARGISLKNNIHSDRVKIKDTQLDIKPSDWGIQRVHWFLWDSAKHELLAKEAQEKTKLNLEKWDIVKLITYVTDVRKINIWLENASRTTFNTFLQEVDQHFKESNVYLFQRHLNNLKICRVGDKTYTPLELRSKKSLMLQHYRITSEQQKAALRAINIELTDSDFVKYPRIRKYLEEMLPYLSDKDARDNFYDRINHQLSIYKRQLANKPNYKFFLYRILNAAVSDKATNELSLFLDSAGVPRPISQMLPYIENREAWLHSYQIKKEENFKQIIPHCMPERKIFSVIIRGNWNRIVQNIKTEAEARELYKSVLVYYAQHRKHERFDQNLPPADKTIFTLSNSFADTSSVFYHPILKRAAIGSYPHLGNAIYSLTGRKVPHSCFFEYDNRYPFKLTPNAIEFFMSPQNFKALNLTGDEAMALLNFLYLKGESKSSYDFFEQGGYIEKRGPYHYQLTQNSEITTCYIKEGSEDLLREFIETNVYLQAGYRLLPNYFARYHNRKHILSGENLVLSLIMFFPRLDGDLIPQFLDFVSPYPSIHKDYINNLDFFTLEVKNKYSPNDFEYKLLAFIIKDYLHKKNDLKTLRSKIRILLPDGGFLDISSISGVGQVTLGSYKIDLGDIFSDRSFEQETKQVRKLIDGLAQSGLDEGQLRQILEVRQDTNVEGVYRELKEKYWDSQKPLENGAQLAFLLAMRGNESNFAYNNFKVLNKKRKVVSLGSQTFYIQNFSFLQPEYVLHEIYESTHKLLRRFGKWETTRDFSILHKPYFNIDSEKFECPGLVKEFLEEHRMELLNFIFEAWQTALASTIRVVKWEQIGGIDFQKIFKFIPKQRLLENCPHKYGRERLPVYLRKWLEETESEQREKENLLMEWGVLHTKSPVVELREHLANNSPFNAANVRRVDKKLLENTLKWAKEEKLELASANLRAIEKIYAQLGPNAALDDTLPWLFIDKIDADGLLNYRFKDFQYNHTYYIDNDSSHQLHKCGISLKEVIEEFHRQKKQVIDLSVYPGKEWGETLSLLTKRLEISEPQPHFNKLVAASEEWITPYIGLWHQKSKTKYRVFLYPGKIPHQILINGKVFKTIHLGDYIEDSRLQNQRLFVNKELETIELLKKALSNDLHFALVQAQEELGDVTNATARVKTKEYLSEIENYDVSLWDPHENETIVATKVRKADNPITIVVKSIELGDFRLNMTEMQALLQGAELFVFDGKQVLRKSLQVK